MNAMYLGTRQSAAFSCIQSSLRSPTLTSQGAIRHGLITSLPLKQRTLPITILRALSEDSQVSASPSTEAAAAALATSPAEKPWQWDESADAVKTYGVLIGVLMAGILPALHTVKLADLPYFISLAVITIYIGAHRGLNAKQRQQISFKEGALAPVFASVAIMGAYLMIKYFPNLSLQALFDAYFWLLGSIALIGGFASPAKHLGEKFGLPAWKVNIPEWLSLKDEDDILIKESDLALTDIFIAIAGITLATIDLQTHHSNFTLNNLIACTIASDILQLVGLKSFRVAGVLLVGLLCYDVFWVFGSPNMVVPSLGLVGDNVMMTVATSDFFTGPTKLLFPRIPGTVGEAASFPFSLLGLGDIAVPGLLACLALRYDASRAIDMRARGIAAAEAMIEAMGTLDPDASGDEVAKATGSAAEAAYDRIADLELEQRNRTQGTSDSGYTNTVFAASDSVLVQRTYFVPVLVAYVAGLGVAFAANAVTGLGQPALLYLCPMTLGAVAAVAGVRGELGRIWGYTDTSSTGQHHQHGESDREKEGGKHVE